MCTARIHKFTLIHALEIYFLYKISMALYLNNRRFYGHITSLMTVHLKIFFRKLDVLFMMSSAVCSLLSGFDEGYQRWFLHHNDLILSEPLKV